MFKLCHYINDDNQVCDAATKRGAHYCRHHLELIKRKMRMARKRRQLLESFLRDNPPNSRKAVLKVKQRISEGIPAGDLGQAQMQILTSAFRLLDDIGRYVSKPACDPRLPAESAPAGEIIGV